LSDEKDLEMDRSWLSKDTFQSATDETKFNLLHDGVVAIYERLESGEDRFSKLENKAKFDKAWAFFGGLLGGAVAVFGKMMIWRQ
jgi:hypothetical protein